MISRWSPLAGSVAFALMLVSPAAAAETPPPWPGDGWRREHRIIDLHLHINGTEAHTARAVRILD